MLNLTVLCVDANEMSNHARNACASGSLESAWGNTRKVHGNAHNHLFVPLVQMEQ